ncbi:MAG: molybdate ABC transporter substrate-binding protein, partial [Planctomycetota bacterium]
ISLAAVIIAVLGASMYMLGESAHGGKASTSSEAVMPYCGAGIRPAVKPVIDEFETETGIRVEASYGGSGQLFGQLSARRKGDLYMPGAEYYVDRAIKKDYADASTKARVAYFIPVILVRNGNPKNVTSLPDFTRDDLKLALGQPKACAIGRRTVKIFDKNSIPYADVKKNVVTNTTTVNELGTAVQMQTVDATIMWDANAKNYTQDGDIVRIPPEQNIPSTIPIVRLSFSDDPDRAQKFIEFLTSPRGQELIREQGYSTSLPGEESTEKADQKASR